ERMVRSAWLAPGAHVTSVGVNPDGAELEDAAVADAAVFVESRDAVLAPFPAGANDLRGLERERLTELGDVLSGASPGRTSAEQITIYKSVGVGVMDAAAAALVLRAATERGAGVEGGLGKSGIPSGSRSRRSWSTVSCASSRAGPNGRTPSRAASSR